MRSPDLASVLAQPGRPASHSRPDDEYVRGWGLMAQEFESGHVLALRAFPEGTFGGFRAVWHRDPGGRWSMYVDSAHPETACPRYFGAATHHTGRADILVDWTGPATARVTMDRPALDWTFTAATTPVLAAVNAVLPVVNRHRGLMVSAGDLLARVLGMGRFTMSMTAPSGHRGTLLPSSMFFVERARAQLEGHDLGRPVRSEQSPRIGDVHLPARAVLATGQVTWRPPVERPPGGQHR